MPLGRLLCFALDRLGYRLPNLPFVISLVGPLSLLAGMLLVYVFVRRELGHPLYGLLALVLFGVTSVYHQAIWWFAASFSVLALDTTLLGLLAAQRWWQTGRAIYLDLTVLACLLAPGWFAIGVLAGPLCFLYLLPCRSGAACSTRHWTLLPLLGTVLFLAISLPFTAQAILHVGHYGEQTAVDAFRPLVGLKYTARSVVDNLLLGLVGVAGVETPERVKVTVADSIIYVPIVLPILAVFVVLGAWWWWQARDRRLMLLGLGMILSSYWLVYSARSNWNYSEMVEPRFSRYHLLPQLGLVLFFCGGLPGRAGSWFTLNENGVLSRGQRRMVYVLIGACFLVHLPRALICGSPTGWEQLAVRSEQRNALRRIEEVDALCREHHVSAADARQALGKLNVRYADENIDGWEFLRGSDDPRPIPVDEVKRLLNAPE
jgi:hypothetical protein